MAGRTGSLTPCMKGLGTGRERRRARGTARSAVPTAVPTAVRGAVRGTAGGVARGAAMSAAIASVLLLAGCSGSSGGSSSPTPSGKAAAPVASTAAPAATTAGAAPAAAAPFGSAITAPGGGDQYTAAFPAGQDGRTTILTATDGDSDSPGVVLQPVGPSGTAGAPTRLEGSDTSAACGTVATTLDGAAAVSTLYFEKRAAQGVVPAEYDAYLYTWDGVEPIAKTPVAAHVQGVPTCADTTNSDVGPSIRFHSPGEDQWLIDGATDSRGTVAVSYLPSHSGKDPAAKDLFVSIGTGKVTPIALPSQEVLDYVVGAGALGACGSGILSNKPCAVSATGRISRPHTACGGGDANCTYSNLYGSDGLAVEAQHTGGIQSTDSLGKVLDPLTGAVRFTTGDVPYPDAAVYDKATGTIVVFGDHGPGSDDNLVAGFDATSGKKLWSVPVAKLCGSNASGVLVAANGQLALLSPRDGKQIASTAAAQDCTPGFGAGIAITSGGTLISLLAG